MGPSGSLESLTATITFHRATSTHCPDAQKLALRHVSCSVSLTTGEDIWPISFFESPCSAVMSRQIGCTGPSYLAIIPPRWAYSRPARGNQPCSSADPHSVVALTRSVVLGDSGHDSFSFGFSFELGFEAADCGDVAHIIHHVGNVGPHPCILDHGLDHYLLPARTRQQLLNLLRVVKLGSAGWRRQLYVGSEWAQENRAKLILLIILPAQEGQSTMVP